MTTVSSISIFLKERIAERKFEWYFLIWTQKYLPSLELVTDVIWNIWQLLFSNFVLDLKYWWQFKIQGASQKLNWIKYYFLFCSDLRLSPPSLVYTLYWYLLCTDSSVLHLTPLEGMKMGIWWSKLHRVEV